MCIPSYFFSSFTRFRSQISSLEHIHFNLFVLFFGDADFGQCGGKWCSAVGPPAIASNDCKRSKAKPAPPSFQLTRCDKQARDARSGPPRTRRGRGESTGGGRLKETRM
ncbi:hypothetical protein R5R35_014049 [Gryllus longicercus]|uniref:Uncharacterized protein n=1 Tax=Gryllus longicercus TaxID=2509291 RepID=A0AAN9W540_9ORTH